MDPAHASERPPVGDTADEADRLAVLMEDETARGGGTSRADRGYAIDPAADDLLDEDWGEDSSDDPAHHGGADPGQAPGPRVVPAELAAMHVVSDDAPDRLAFTEGAQVPEPATPEDATLLGVDPYEP